MNSLKRIMVSISHNHNGFYSVVEDTRRMSHLARDLMVPEALATESQLHLKRKRYDVHYFKVDKSDRGRRWRNRGTVLQRTKRHHPKVEIKTPRNARMPFKLYKRYSICIMMLPRGCKTKKRKSRRLIPRLTNHLSMWTRITAGVWATKGNLSVAWTITIKEKRMKNLKGQIKLKRSIQLRMSSIWYS